MAKLTNVAHPYANALFEIAKTSSSMDDWLFSLERLSIAASTVEFRNLVDNPEIQKNQVLEILLKISNNSSSDMQNFLQLLIVENRLEVLPDIYQLFKESFEKYSNTATAIIQSAYPISEKEQEEFAVILAKKLEKTIKVEVEIVEELLGGVKILVDDLVIDASVKGSLEKLAATIK